MARATTLDVLRQPASPSASALAFASPSTVASTVAPAALPRPRSRPPLLFVAALLAVYFLWGSTYLAIRIALETIPPFTLGALRFLIAGGGLYLVLRLRGRQQLRVRQPDRRHRPRRRARG